MENNMVARAYSNDDADRRFQLYLAEDDVSPLTTRLIHEAGLVESELTPAQRERFADVVQALSPPENLTVHRSVSSRGKRAIDVVGSLVGLAGLAIVGIPIAVAIRANSKGPTFFKQTRCGVGGKTFVMWKFRSMVDVSLQEADGDDIDKGAGYSGKSSTDRRVTAVGRVLRSTSLDELPQLLNVLRGDMSLVGTRPPTPFEVSSYNRRSWDRLRVKTGLTGEWQVSGRSEIKDFSAVVDLDLAYQERWTIRHDMALIARTIPAAIGRKGAV